MPFPSISNRKFAATILPTNNGVLWDDDKLLLPSRGRSGSSWTARNRLALMAAGGSVIAVLLLVLIGFGVHLAEERRDLARLCGRLVTDTLREVYIKGKDVREEDESSVAADAVAGGGKNTRKKHKVLGVVGIQTGFDSVLRRNALRETWFPSTPEGILSLEMATGLAFRFVIGHSTDDWKMQELDKEIAEHKDFIRIDVDESYQNLNLKTLCADDHYINAGMNCLGLQYRLAFFKAVYMLFDADFYVKADDDIYLRPDRLATLLAKERPTPRTYLGCMKKGPVITDPKMKWYEPNGYLLGSDYFLHAYGPIYALSAEVVASVSVARNNSYRMFMNEDVTIGAWMLAMDVTHEHNHALCDPECRPESIAVWDVPKCSGLCHPTEQLARLHQDPMCSMNDTHFAR